MTIEIASPEELAEIAEISKWLRERRMALHCRYTAKRKPKEVKVLLYDKRQRRYIASA